MGTIFIVNKNDVDKNLDYICYDESDTWALVVPNTYENWEIYKPKIKKYTKNQPPITFEQYIYIITHGYINSYSLCIYKTEIIRYTSKYGCRNGTFYDEYV